MSKAVQDRILSLEREQARAINRGNVTDAMRLFSKTFVGFSSTKHARIRGLKQLASTFRYYLRRSPAMTYRISQPRVHVSGTLAVATFYWAVGLGKNRTIRGRGTHVFTRAGKDWKVIHEHFSRAH